MLRRCAALACVLAAPPVAAEVFMPPQAQVALRECLEATKPPPSAEPWEQLVNLENACPRVHAWLATASEAGSVGSIRVSAPEYEALLDLEALARGSRRDRGAGPALGLERVALDAILEEVSRTPEQPKTLWQRFVDWIKVSFEPGDMDSEWLEELIEALTMPEWVADWILRVALAILILAALVVVGNEAWLFGWRRGRSGAGTAGHALPLHDKATVPGWEEIDALPPRPRVAAAVRRMVVELADRLDLRFADSRTNRELLRLLPGGGLAPGGDARASAALLNDIDAILYGDRPVAEERAGAVARECRRLAGGHNAPDLASASPAQRPEPRQDG